jgi:hypothetical protein
MKMSYLFAGLLLGAMLPTVALCTPNVTGKWSGSLQMDGENDAKPAYSIFNQDGNNLSGSVGPNEDEQDSFEGGKVEDDKLTFDVPQGPNGEGSIHVVMQVKGDQMLRDAQSKHRRLRGRGHYIRKHEPEPSARSEAQFLSAGPYWEHDVDASRAY